MRICRNLLTRKVIKLNSNTLQAMSIIQHYRSLVLVTRKRICKLAIIKQDAMLVRNAVILLENKKESLHKAIRKLKLENGRMKLKIKTLNEKVGKSTNEKLVDVDDGRAPESEYDYDDLNRDFYLIGGIHDPLSLRCEVTIRDKEGIEHKSAERFYW
uniref:Uncharacterized protein n=1 Tax=Meloidogyne enterolobii TaxID=390850 RepID=A0A6V7W7R0_MELEN|nr:unnamed protein product [Meloidogyne enterolobii]